MRPSRQMCPGMMPAFALPAEITPGQLGPISRDFDPHSLRVADVMHTPVHTIDASQPAIEALLAMRRHGVRRLPVTGEFGELAGIVSLDDLLEAYASDLSLFAHAIRRERRLEQRVMV